MIVVTDTSPLHYLILVGHVECFRNSSAVWLFRQQSFTS